jgi:hypothetical protein
VGRGIFESKSNGPSVKQKELHDKGVQMSQTYAVKPFNVIQFKVFPYLTFNFNEPKSIISLLNYLQP